MCGIIAILLQQGHVATELHEGLGVLQHRGQDAAGIVTCGPKGRFYQVKANGMVRDVFEPSNIANWLAQWGWGMSVIQQLVHLHMQKPSRSMLTVRTVLYLRTMEIP